MITVMPAFAERESSVTFVLPAKEYTVSNRSALWGAGCQLALANFNEVKRLLETQNY
tara:strand:- start:434 stop:604 length:171 start_codon:yes stop_codon:yes gene_type:complete